MNRRRRIFFRSALGLALLVTATMWVRSHWRCDSVQWTDSRRFVSLISSGGRLNLTESHWDNGTAWPAGFKFTSWSRRQIPPHWETTEDVYNRRRFAGFEWSDGLWPMDQQTEIFLSFHVPTYRLIAVPYWFIAAIVSAPLLRAGVVARRRNGRIARQLCPDCGYDLRGSPERCPECGAAAATASAATTGVAVS